ncbi:hypothetical protein [Dokdonella sp.]|uniref:hypothetical protein n=1 Tax=Dokdonella sp. TaxID=2291710 RepID=UPI0025B86CC3|nr:hypothetical protein [Dokdonella sp.]MBX3690665.1 hypothetical protein [Dokdonella sp.]MCW5569021.1 hypothetical protein [Dokdonella sp.]
MNDFEIQRRLRELRVVREPGRDLWPDIRVRLRTVQSAARTRARPRRWLPLSAAAMFAVATTTGLFAIAVQRQGAQPTAPDRAAVSVREQIERARDLALRDYPDLAGAEIVLDSANAELERALREQPGATYLVDLANLTHAQRRKLARLGLQAGQG